MSGLRARLYYRLFGADGGLREALPADGTVLDVGCSDGKGSALLGERAAFGVDIYRPSLVAAKRSGSRKSPIQADVRRLPYRDGSFDACVALDVIEHFEKDDALAVIAEMERVASKRVCLFTPSGFVPQHATAEEPWQEHRCGFTGGELESLGYAVIGVGGDKRLRGDLARIRLGPVGVVAVLLSRRLTRHRPASAYHLFAVKVVS